MTELTDEQIDVIWPTRAFHTFLRSFARAVIAADRQLNQVDAEIARMQSNLRASLTEESLLRTELSERIEEVEWLKNCCEKADRTMTVLDYRMERNLIAMQAAVIDLEKRGPGDAIAWIVNTLDGSDLLPDTEDVKAFDSAQAWFDSKISALDEWRRASRTQEAKQS